MLHTGRTPSAVDNRSNEELTKSNMRILCQRFGIAKKRHMASCFKVGGASTMLRLFHYKAACRLQGQLTTGHLW